MSTWTSLLLGELLSRQAAGWYQFQLQGNVSIGVERSAGPFQLVGELLLSGHQDQSALLRAGQLHTRLAALPGVHASAGSFRFELGIGPSVGLRLVRWQEPVELLVPVVEPGARARSAVVWGAGAWRFEIAGGWGIRAAGGDYDLGLGVRKPW